MLIGTFRHSIDEKKRMRVPTKLKAELGEGFVVTKGNNGCLFAFSKTIFDEDVIAKARGLSMFDAEYLLVFMENIVQTYLRSRVRLSDGTKGEIIMMNKQRYSKPVIAIKNGFINLLEHPEFSIEEIYV